MLVHISLNVFQFQRDWVVKSSCNGNHSAVTLYRFFLIYRYRGRFPTAAHVTLVAHRSEHSRELIDQTPFVESEGMAAGGDQTENNTNTSKVSEIANGVNPASESPVDQEGLLAKISCYIIQKILFSTIHMQLYIPDNFSGNSIVIYRI